MITKNMISQENIKKHSKDEKIEMLKNQIAVMEMLDHYDMRRFRKAEISSFKKRIVANLLRMYYVRSNQLLPRNFDDEVPLDPIGEMIKKMKN